MAMSMRLGSDLPAGLGTWGRLYTRSSRFYSADEICDHDTVLLEKKAGDYKIYN